MTKRHTPPTRKSKLWVVVVKPLGPHHSPSRLGSVKQENTSARGASNTRTPSITFGSLSRSRLLLADMAFLLARLLFFALQLTQIVVEAVEPLFPEPAVALEPFVHVLERLWLDLAGPPLRLARAGDQAGPLQHLEVLRDGRPADIERF